jgi:hypothetical protein
VRAPTVAAAQVGPNLVINGDFEDTTGCGCNTNISNAAYNALVSNSTAFGNGQEIDVMDASCWGTAKSGVMKIGISSSSFTQTKDELSLTLSMPVRRGASYQLRLWIYGNPAWAWGPAGRVEVGLSDSPTAFGTRVYLAGPTPNLVWTLHEAVFVSPVDASYLTLNSGADFGNWSEIDAIELRLTCTPSAVIHCTANQNSLGCLPSISSTGCASA